MCRSKSDGGRRCAGSSNTTAAPAPVAPVKKARRVRQEPPPVLRAGKLSTEIPRAEQPANSRKASRKDHELATAEHDIGVYRERGDNAHASMTQTRLILNLKAIVAMGGDSTVGLDEAKARLAHHIADAEATERANREAAEQAYRTSAWGRL